MKVIKSKAFIKIIGLLAVIEGLAMIPCAIIGCIFHESTSTISFIVLGSVLFAYGYLIVNHFRNIHFELRTHESYLISCFCWIFCSLIGALPFYCAGMGYGLIDSIFESFAGFTTTGCTCFDLDFMPKSLTLWRAISNWLGGMGILVLVCSILPALGAGGQSIASTETTGPNLIKIGGKFSDTGRFLYTIYIGFSVVEFILLAISPLNWYDALVNTLSSVSTGGLLVTTQNEALFSNVYVRLVIIVFTCLSSMNYTTYFYCLKGNFKAFFSNVEIRVFWIIIGSTTILITLDLWLTGTYSSFIHALKDSMAQVVSFITTSGYFVCEYTNWPTFSVVLLTFLIVLGGCSMSTSGSLKVIRVIALFKMINRNLFKQVHPQSVKPILIQGKPLAAEKASSITTHILLYFAVLLFSILVLSLNGLSTETTVTTALSIFSNTGMALGEVGSTGFFGMFNGFSKLYLCLLMLAGRLEVYALIMMFTKSFWQEDKSNTL